MFAMENRTRIIVGYAVVILSGYFSENKLDQHISDGFAIVYLTCKFIN
jgi:hypothetical protein